MASPLQALVGLRVDELHDLKHFGSWHTEGLGCVMRDDLQFGNFVFASMKDNVNGHAFGRVPYSIRQNRRNSNGPKPLLVDSDVQRRAAARATRYYLQPVNLRS